ncbi:MAG: hypothetical protein MK324_18670, partial [Pirellulales bacterium]|nr:hypothetical protein [Pirellulales bacterium]
MARIAGLLVFILTTSLNAQTFTDVTAKAKLNGFSGATVSFVDFNNDGFQDINAVLDICINNGDCRFVLLASTSLP